MATSRIALDTTQYVRVNFGLNPMIIEAAEGEVKVAVTTNQPSLTNKAFHRVSDRARLVLDRPDAHVWVLATTPSQKAVVTEQIVNADIISDADGTGNRLSTMGIISDRLGRSAKVSQKGELLTASNTDDIDVNFQYTIRSAETVETTTGTGTVSHPGAGGSYAELSPGTGVGSAELVSRRAVRYRAGHEVYCELSHIFRTPESNLNQWFGFINDSDRLAVGYQGLDLGILFREGGNDTFVSRDDFTLDKLDGTGPSGFTIDPQTINVSRCAFVWHGGLPLTVEMQVGQQWYPVHVFDFSNQITETHLENPNLPVGGLIERTSGTGTDEAMRTGSWRGGSIAAAVDEPSDDWTGHTVLDVTLSSGNRTNIMTLINPLTWQGKANHILYELGVVTFRSSANKDLALYGTKGATIIGGGAITDINVANYALQYQELGTVTGGTRGSAATILGAGERERIDTRDTGILIYPGEAFTIEADAGGAVNGTFSCATRLIHEG